METQKESEVSVDDKAEQVSIEILIEDYKQLKSAYRVAEKHNTSATKVKRLLKQAGVLRTQSLAAKGRDNSHLDYERTPEHKKHLSECAKKRTGDKNPFFGKKHKEDVKNKMSEAAKERTAERNPNYKNGSYERRPRDFKIAEFTKLRSFVFNRDEYTCHYCKCIGGHMHAHHKIPFWVNKDAFLDVNNLVTVCTECHFEHAHKGSWQKFDINLIDERLIKQYKLDRERLNELAGDTPDAIVRPSTINKIDEPPQK